MVLGLKAFVLAHPYDVPQWLPDLLLLLVRASLQPAPIKTSVRYFADGDIVSQWLHNFQ